MTFKTMAELNKAEPHLRDLEITVDGLNVVDINLLALVFGCRVSLFRFLVTRVLMKPPVNVACIWLLLNTCVRHC